MMGTPSKFVTNSGRSVMLEPINVPKASDILAERLRGLILSGKIPEGERLPTERELVEDSGLSRSSVREALRALEVEGLIATRPGRAGGSTVTLPGSGSVARSMELFVKTHGIRLPALLDCRLAVEPFLAGRAAENRTEEDLARIRDLHAQFTRSTNDVLAYKRINLDWHLAVARASGNEVLIVLMEAISQPIYDAADYKEVTTKRIRDETVKAHAAIVDAIEIRDAAAAVSRMQRHLSAYIEVANQTLIARKG
jgi:GntR family transcriptional regulator, transcriptional repressor for pyruvate dehydrogenase complex